MSREVCFKKVVPFLGFSSLYILQAKKEEKLGKNAASRVSKFVPSLVYSMEQYERYLIQVRSLNFLLNLFMYRKHALTCPVACGQVVRQTS